MGRESQHEHRARTRFRRIRDLRGLTQEELGRRAGFPRHVIAAIESGTRRIMLAEAIALCETLGVDLAQVVSPEPMSLTIETAVI